MNYSRLLLAFAVQSWSASSAQVVALPGGGQVEVEPACTRADMEGCTLSGICGTTECVTESALEHWHDGNRADAVAMLRSAVYGHGVFRDNTILATHLGTMVEETEGKTAALTVHRENVERGSTTRLEASVGSMYELGRLYKDHGEVAPARRMFSEIVAALDAGQIAQLPPHWSADSEFRGTLQHHLGVLAAMESNSALGMKHFREAFDADPNGLYYRLVIS